MVYQYLVNNVAYEYEALARIDEKGLIGPISYPYYNKWGLGSHEKYAPIILNKGTCSGIAHAFADICDSLGIKNSFVSGKTKLIDQKKQVYLQHIWNVIQLDNQKGHVDVTYAILNRDQGFDQECFFFLTNEELQEVGPHHAFDEEIVAKKKTM